MTKRALIISMMVFGILSVGWMANSMGFTFTNSRANRFLTQ